MNSIVYVALILVSIVLLKIIFKIDFKKAEKLEENKELEKLTDKFPENVDIAKEMLAILKNEKVKVEEAKDTKTSLYIAVTDKILIADMKNNYARIQTIAHECLHSIQDRRLLIFNFIFSNIIMLYWLAIAILTATKVIQNIEIPIFVLLLFATIKLLVRGFLETDAMTKSRYLAEKYIKLKNILNEEETEKLLKQYDEVNKLGIPFTLAHILTGSFVGILIYAIIGLVI